MSNNHNHSFWSKILALLMPEYILAQRLDEKITGKDFISLSIKNLLFFAFCTLLIILAEILIFHSFDPRELLPYFLSDILLSLLFAVLQILWIAFRRKDLKHFAQYKKNNN
ncbi:MAG: hypothetical protein IJ785_05535 [Bacteroidales bacterium]|nr:hypothetical protein [Bacteroidales bacterium]